MFGIGKLNVEKMERKRDVKGLIKALNYKTDKFIREESARALDKIGDKRAVEPIIQE